MRNGDFSEVLALNPSFRIYDPTTARPPAQIAPSSRRDYPGRPHQQHLEEDQAWSPKPNNPGTNNGLQDNLYLPRHPKADRDNYDVKVNWNRTTSAPDRQVLDDAGAGVRPLRPAVRRPSGGGDTRTLVFTTGQTWTTAIPRLMSFL